MKTVKLLIAAAILLASPLAQAGGTGIVDSVGFFYGTAANDFEFRLFEFCLFGILIGFPYAMTVFYMIRARERSERIGAFLFTGLAFLAVWVISLAIARYEVDPKAPPPKRLEPPSRGT